MKVQYCSDLHLEFAENKLFLKQHPLQSVGEILLLAGDIVPFALMDKHKDFFNFISDNFSCTYWVPGNHEYYYSDASKRSGILNEKIRSNVFLVNNTVIEHETLNLIFSTLWSKIHPENEWQIERRMSDFYAIKYHSFRFSAKPFNELNTNCLNFIKTELEKERKKKTIVVTHHVPTFLHYPEKYKGDILNEAFAIELFDLIESSNADYWIYGHHHHNAVDFKIGKTTLSTNQLGYVQAGEHRYFKKDKLIEWAS